MATFVTCSKNCKSSQVSEYGDDYAKNKPVEKHFCGHCNAPMRKATPIEIARYLKAKE